MGGTTHTKGYVGCRINPAEIVQCLYYSYISLSDRNLDDIFISYGQSSIPPGA